MPVPSFCPHCGARTRPVAGSIGLCDGCGREVYANSKPTAGVFLERAGEVLLVRRAREPAKGRWDVPGGFLDEAETAEDGARREIHEELGVELGDLRLLFTSINALDEYAVLDIMFEASWPDGAVPRPADDVDECRWFALGSLPDDLAFASTGPLLERWRELRRGRGRRLLDGELDLDGAGGEVVAELAIGDRLPAGWSVECGDWAIHDGALCGRVEGERPAVIWLDRDIEGDHAIAFRARTVAPHGNDINCFWEGSGRILGAGDVACAIAGFGGWWDGLSGIERYPEGGLRATARLLALVAGQSYDLVAGRRGDADFLFVDGALALQLDEPGRVRRQRSRVALATWDSHVHFLAARAYRLPPS